MVKLVLISLWWMKLVLVKVFRVVCGVDSCVSLVNSMGDYMFGFFVGVKLSRN